MYKFKVAAVDDIDIDRIAEEQKEDGVFVSMIYPRQRDHVVIVVHNDFLSRFLRGLKYSSSTVQFSELAIFGYT